LNSRIVNYKKIILDIGEAMEKLTSIEITNRASGGPYYEDEIVAETVKIYRTGKIKHLQYNGLSEKPINEFDYTIEVAEMNTFFDQLVSDIKVYDWVEDYSVPVCDGWSWEFKIRYSDNKIKKVIGTVEPPPRGDLLKSLINKITDFQVEPWIF
jgi:hypothetical protein